MVVERNIQQEYPNQSAAYLIKRQFSGGGLYKQDKC